MKWWHWLILELLIIFGVIAWIYFFPSEEFEGDFAKGLVGFVLFYALETTRNYCRRKGDKMIVFEHPGLGGRRVVIRGFKLDDGKLRCELCSKPCLPKDLGTLTVTHKDTGETETHKVCLECGKKLGAEGCMSN